MNPEPATYYVDRAIDILRATHDGDDLDPRDLKLVETMVNAGIYDVPETLEAAFLNLYERACMTPGGYQKPWLHDIEHLTRDHEGYIYWKNHQVEHYSFRYSKVDSDGVSGFEQERKAALELARRCRLLEERGEPVNCTNAIWRWQPDDTLRPDTEPPEEKRARLAAIAEMNDALFGEEK
jgi:hypothetical protein